MTFKFLSNAVFLISKLIFTYSTVWISESYFLQNDAQFLIEIYNLFLTKENKLLRHNLDNPTERC